jgi:membrane protease YdiL (CAAX protease family)
MTTLRHLDLPRPGTEWLLGIATAALYVFYYVLRADAVGVYSVARGWNTLAAVRVSLPAHYVGAAFILGVVPVVAAVLITGMRPKQLGLGLGDWRAGIACVAAGLPLAIVAGWVASTGAPMRAVYPLDPAVTAELGSFAPYAALQFLYYGAWEVLFRGVLLFGLAGRMGSGGANLAQTGLSVTAHFGRAWSETLSALPAGIIFGLVTLRLRSIWYIAVIHWVVGISMDWFILASR